MMHGFGCGLLTPMVFAIPSQWFRKHRGVATGIVVAGASFGGAVPSLVVQVCHPDGAAWGLLTQRLVIGNVGPNRLP